MERSFAAAKGAVELVAGTAAASAAAAGRVDWEGKELAGVGDRAVVCVDGKTDGYPHRSS